MTRATALGSVTLMLLGTGVLAAPPVPQPSGLTGGTVAFAPQISSERGHAFTRPRAGAYITAMDPDPRGAIPVRAATTVEFNIHDAQEIVVFAPNRPVRVRLGILFHGKPLAAMWRERLRTAFDYFDRDRDGVLNAFEVQNILSDTGVVQLLQNGFYQPTPQDRPTLDRLDTDGDRKVSFEEFAAYYKAASAHVFRPQPPAAENPLNAAATEAMFKLMDANADGKLTKDEVKAIEKLVATKDLDEDECLSLNELLPNLTGQRLAGGANQVIQPNGIPYPPAPNTASQTVVTYEPGRVPGTLTQQVIRRYDKDGDFELTRDESGFDEATFARLDKDGNGRLDGEELDEWRTGPADFEISLSLGEKATDCVARLVTDAQSFKEQGFSVRQVETGRLIIRTGRQPIEFWAYATVAGYQQPRLKQQYQYLFQQAAAGKEYVLEKDLTGPNAVQFQFLRTLFDPADRNGDGKLTRPEFDAYFDLQDAFRNIALAITPAVQTPTLFQLLDENRDGRLGVRELRTAWDRLIALEPGNAEIVTRAAIQPSVSLRLTHSLERFTVYQVQFDGDFQNANPGVPLPQKGPLWFRRMDRNADGDISRSEFLGTRAEFDAIDTDHDDLISLEEAEAYDKQMRGAEEHKAIPGPRAVKGKP